MRMVWKVLCVSLVVALTLGYLFVLYETTSFLKTTKDTQHVKGYALEEADAAPDGTLLDRDIARTNDDAPHALDAKSPR